MFVEKDHEKNGNKSERVFNKMGSKKIKNDRWSFGNFAKCALMRYQKVRYTFDIAGMPNRRFFNQKDFRKFLSLI